MLNTNENAATPTAISNWNDYAAKHKKCFLKYERVRVQATRTEPAREFRQWVLFLPSPCVIGTMHCANIEQAREVAAQYGCSIIL
jgi:hypothetical protein